MSIHIFIYACVYICMFIYTYLYIYIYIYTLHRIYNLHPSVFLITLPCLLNFLKGPTFYICSNVPFGTVSLLKILLKLVSPLQLFLDVLQCSLMILAL